MQMKIEHEAVERRKKVFFSLVEIVIIALPFVFVSY